MGRKTHPKNPKVYLSNKLISEKFLFCAVMSCAKPIRRKKTPTFQDGYAHVNLYGCTVQQTREIYRKFCLITSHCRFITAISMHFSTPLNDILLKPVSKLIGPMVCVSNFPSTFITSSTCALIFLGKTGNLAFRSFIIHVAT